MKQRGFTLVELLLVIIIIGILASLAIPRFGRQADEAMETEAKLMLTQIQKLQYVYYIENKAYSNSLDEIGFEQEELITESDNGTARYRLRIIKADEDGFVAEAVPQVKDLRTYRIEQKGKPYEHGN